MTESDLKQIANAVTAVFMERLKDSEAAMNIRLDAGLTAIREEFELNVKSLRSDWQKELLDTTAFRNQRDDASFTETIENLKATFTADLVDVRKDISANVEALLVKFREHDATFQATVETTQEQIRSLAGNLHSGLEETRSWAEGRLQSALDALPAPPPPIAVVADSELTDNGHALAEVLMRTMVGPTLDARAAGIEDRITNATRALEIATVYFNNSLDSRATVEMVDSIKNSVEETSKALVERLGAVEDNAVSTLRRLDEEVAARQSAISVASEQVRSVLEDSIKLVSEDTKLGYTVAIELAAEALHDKIAKEYVEDITPVKGSVDVLKEAVNTFNKNADSMAECLSSVMQNVDKMFDTIGAVRVETEALAKRVDEHSHQEFVRVDVEQEHSKAVLEKIDEVVDLLGVQIKNVEAVTIEQASDIKYLKNWQAEHSHESIESTIDSLRSVQGDTLKRVEDSEIHIIELDTRVVAGFKSVEIQTAELTNWQKEHTHEELADSITTLSTEYRQALGRLQADMGSSIEDARAAAAVAVEAAKSAIVSEVDERVATVRAAIPTLPEPIVLPDFDGMLSSAATAQLRATSEAVEELRGELRTYFDSGIKLALEALPAIPEPVVLPDFESMLTEATAAQVVRTEAAINAIGEQLRPELEKTIKEGYDKFSSELISFIDSSVQVEVGKTTEFTIGELRTSADKVNEELRSKTLIAIESANSAIETRFSDMQSTMQQLVDTAVDTGVAALAAKLPDMVTDAVAPAVLAAVPKTVADVAPAVVADALAGAVGPAAADAVAKALPDALAEAVGPATVAAVARALPDALAGAVGPAVALAVPDAVGKAVPPAVAAAVPDVVSAAVTPAVSSAIEVLHEARLAPVLEELQGAVRQLPELVNASVEDAQGEVVRASKDSVRTELEPILYERVAEHIKNFKPVIEQDVITQVERVLPPNIENLESKLLLSLLNRFEAAVSRIPLPKDGKDGKDGTNGKDAEPARFAPPVAYERGRRYTHGTWVAHENGLWVAARDTAEEPTIDSPCWDCIAPGISGIEAMLEDDGRTLKFLAQLANGKETQYRLTLPIPVPRDVYAADKIYSERDWVTHGGAVWEAKKSGMLSAPGTDGSWKLVIKKGQDGKAARPGPAAAWRFVGDWEFEKLYQPGDIVSHAGPRWLALKSTRERPPFVQLVSNDVWQKLPD